MAYQKKPKKVITEEELQGIIVKGEGSYSLRNMGKITRITRVNDVKFIDGLDIEEHNKKFLEEMKAKRDNYGEDGYNELGFNEEGIHRNGSELSDEGYNSKGWVKYETRGTTTTKPLNTFTGGDRDLDGYDKYGFDIEGYTEDGYDQDGYGRDGFNASGFNKEGINRETGTIYGTDGFTQDGVDKDGYNRDGINKNGKTRDDVAETKHQQRKNFLGLRELAQGYANGTISIEDYLKNHKISLDELIDFAKKQGMDRDTIVGLHNKKTEYNQHKKLFNKSQYLKDIVSINGVPITEEMVDKVLNYLTSNDRLLSNKIVQEHIRKYANGELEIDEEEKSQDENMDKQEQDKEIRTKKHAKEEMKEVAMNERLENVNGVTQETSYGVRTETQIENENYKNMEE